MPPGANSIPRRFAPYPCAAIRRPATRTMPSGRSRRSSCRANGGEISCALCFRGKFRARMRNNRRRRYARRRLLHRALAALGIFQSLSAESQERNRFVEQALALVRVPERLANDSPRHARAEIVGIIEPVHRFHHFLALQTGIFEVRKLMAADIGESFGGE